MQYPYVKKPESILKSIEIQIEKKLFRIDLKENNNGRFLPITESTMGHQNRVILPATGLEAFRDALNQMIAASQA